MPRLSLRSILASLALALSPVALAAQQAPDPIAQTGFIKEFGTMWTFDAPPLTYWKAAYDFVPAQGWLDHVRLAAVRIPGCSASIVSDRGLVMTNHHCARACITAASPKDVDYQAVGFVAPRDEEEPSCAGMNADQLQSMEDVTAAIRQAVTGRATTERVAQRDAAIERIQDECARQTGLICQVVTFYQGGMYSLYRYQRYTDLRLVMAPEEAISFFGGDPDNFTYPRYDLDVTFLRIYHNGKPLAAEHYLRWNAAGAAEGEVVFVVGNPGSTGRMLTLAQMEYLRDVQYPSQLALLRGNVEAYRALSQSGDEARRRHENAIFSAENAIKAITGYRNGLLDGATMARKKRFEDEFKARVSADPKLRTQYGGSWAAVARAQQELGTFATERQYHSFTGSQLFGMAGNLVLLPGQQVLPEGQRLAPFQGPGLDRIKGQLGRDIKFDLDAEEAMLAAQFRLAKATLPAGDSFLVAAMGNKTPAEAAKALVRGTRLVTAEARKALIEGGASAISASDDPMMVLA
ncbi:MAG: S46 family peptidase, partial [Gemmatimonadota bacterium]